MDVLFADLIPVVAILASVAFAAMAVRIYQLRIESRQMERQASIEAGEKRRLEQRLAVLERIVTDRGLQTAEQIEALGGREIDQLRQNEGEVRR